MSSYLYQPDPLRSSDIATSDFVETLEYTRFVEFAEACRRYRYIGLCHGVPGIGKTLSARRLSQADRVENHDLWHHGPIYGLPIATAFYTAPVVNMPSQVAAGLLRVTGKLAALARGPMGRQEELALDTIRLRNENYRRAHAGQPGYQAFEDPPLEPTYQQVVEQFSASKKAIGDPTTLILIDEADRLRMSSLEQVRSQFDDGNFGLVLIGMPGIEKRMARYPQFYSRIGFVHEFRPLAAPEVRRLLARRWAPAGVALASQALSEEAEAAVLRVTGGNFRLLHRLLAQVERVLEINGLNSITKEVVEVARQSLVIGQI